MGAGDVDESEGLLERGPALEQLAADIAEARDGRGRVTLISGPAGAGKTSVARCADREATTVGMRVLRARGTHLERRFAFGVVRQLFERVLLSSPPDEQSRLLSGPARPAGALLGAPDPPDLSDENRSFAFLHGLYAFLANLAERVPILVLVDDAHWADTASLRWLSYVAGRLHGVAALGLLVTREPVPADSDPSLAAIAAEPSTRSMAIPALTPAASSVLVERHFGQSVAPQFSAACYTATGGNPFFIGELCRALRDARVAPTADGAPRVAEQGPATLARSVLLRIAQLSSDAAALARALAVLGSDAELHDAAVLASLDDASASDAARRLAEEQVIVGDRQLSFAHPIVQSSIYADIPGPSRADAHGRAARLLAQTGAPAERLAAHLLIAYSAGDTWTVHVLGRAAADALDRGAPDSAAAYLRRALAEPPPGQDRQAMLAQLGWAEYLAHERHGAVEHLIEALHLAHAPSDRATLVLRIARVLVIAEFDRSAEAVEILDSAIPDISPSDSQIRMRLEAQLIAAASLKLSTRGRHREWIEKLRGRALGESYGERLLLVNLVSSTLKKGVPGDFPKLAAHVTDSGTPAEIVCWLIEYALADGQLLREEGPESELFYMAASALYVADWLGRSAHWFDQARDAAHRRGSVVGFALASAFRAEVAYRAGDLPGAEAHARAAMTFAPGDVTAVLVNILVERGELAEAAAIIDRHLIDADGDHLMLQPVIAARGRLRIAQRRLREGADDLLAVGRWLDRWPVENPGVVAWRSSLAPAMAQLGEPERAKEMAGVEVELARGLAQPRALGLALREAALLEKPADGIDLLRDAVGVLEGSEARLEHARALTELGAALRRAGSRTDAREPLRQAVAMSHRCGAEMLTARARTELLATGARPRRIALTGRESLTVAERRVAEMAAEGQTNPEIAQALFVTPKTVETHLGHAYQKLDIHSRNQLARALAATNP